jgi:heat shock protein HslJ
MQFHYTKELEIGEDRSTFLMTNRTGTKPASTASCNWNTRENEPIVLGRNKMNLHRPLAVVLAALVLVGLAAGCGRGGKAAQEAASLDGTSWVLIRLLDEALIPDTAITLEFQEGQVAGSAGCNRYFGAVKIKGDTLSIGPVGSTEMFCAEPEGLMDQETAYLQLLGTTTRFEGEGDELSFLDQAGQTTLVFAPAAD